MQSIHTSNAASAASISATERAATEQISALEQVGRHLAAGTVAANAPAATDREPTTDELAAPGLLATIEAYYDGMARFNLAPNFPTDDETQAFAAKTYEPHWDALKAWRGHATTWAEAMEAMRLADRALQEGDDDLAAPLVSAARHFFDHVVEKSSQLPAAAKEAGRAFDAIEEMQSIVRLARLAIADRITLFQDFETIDTKEPIRLVEDINRALGLVDRQASEAFEVINGLFYKALGAAGRGV